MSSKEVINKINVTTMILERKREALRLAEDLSVMLQQDEDEHVEAQVVDAEDKEDIGIEVEVSAGQAVESLIESLSHQCLKMEWSLISLNKSL